jgi:hypothetical protein
MAKADFKTAAVPQCLRHGGDDAWGDERAADLLHCPRIDAKPSSDLALSGPSRRRQGLTNSFSRAGALIGATRFVFTRLRVP